MNKLMKDRQESEIMAAQLRYWKLASEQLERIAVSEVSAFRRELARLVTDHSGLCGWFSGKTVPVDRFEEFLRWQMGEWGERLGLDVQAEVARLLEFMPVKNLEPSP